ncbi:MAG: VTT domain-containing protein [Acidobacteriota bacterium]
MEDVLDFILRYKYPVLFAFVLAEQIGLPVPALPFLLAAGALVRTGQLHLGMALGLAVLASVISDLLWYQLGRKRGIKVLNLLCRISLEPDSCVRRTEDLFARHGARSLLVAKFLPGFNTVAPPLAGIFGMRLSRFVLYDGLGALLWIGTFGGLGFAFGHQLEELSSRITELGSSVGAVLIALLVVYIVVKYIQRQRFLRELRIARITPAELQLRMSRGEDIVVVDLRHSVEFEAEPESIPGALHVPVEDVDTRTGEIPQGPEVVLFCK